MGSKAVAADPTWEPGASTAFTSVLGDAGTHCAWHGQEAAGHADC